MLQKIGVFLIIASFSLSLTAFAEVSEADWWKKKEAFEVVIDATGVIPVMNRTPEFTRKGGTILLFGVPPKTNVEFDAFTLFLKGLTILSSFTSVRNSIQAIELLKNKRVNVKQVISHRLPLAEFERGVNLINQKQENVKKVLITPNR